MEVLGHGVHLTFLVRGQVSAAGQVGGVRGRQDAAQTRADFALQKHTVNVDEVAPAHTKAGGLTVARRRACSDCCTSDSI